MDIRIGMDGEKRKVESALAVPTDGGVGLFLTVTYGSIAQVRLLVTSEELAALVKVALTGERQELCAALADPSQPR